MRVAVVVPCFNDGAFLLEALASLEGQEPHELVVVDDGSTDRTTLEILTRLEQQDVRVYRQPNSGLGAARMAGIRETTAPLIHPLDADDLLPPGALRVLADAIERHRTEAAWGRFEVFGALQGVCPTARDLDPWRITFLDEITGTCMVRRSALEAVGGWDDVAYEDWDLWMKFAERGFTGVGVEAVTLLYRQHEVPSLLARSQANHDRHWAVLEARHAQLMGQRSINRRSSSSPLRVRWGLTLVDALPLPHSRRAKLFVAMRHLLQPSLSSEAFRGPAERARDLFRGRASKRKAATRSVSDSSEP